MVVRVGSGGFAGSGLGCLGWIFLGLVKLFV